MKVRALVSFASPIASPSAGEVIDVPEPQAAAWIKARLVEVVRAVPVETAVAPPIPEKAVTRRSK